MGTPGKADANLKKHGVDFADAVGVFEDEWALTMKEHYVGNEQRFVSMGNGFSWSCACCCVHVQGQ